MPTSYRVIEQKVEEIMNLRSELASMQRRKKPVLEIVVDPDDDDERTRVPVVHLIAGMTQLHSDLMKELEALGVTVD